MIIGRLGFEAPGMSNAVQPPYKQRRLEPSFFNIQADIVAVTFPEVMVGVHHL